MVQHPLEEVHEEADLEVGEDEDVVTTSPSSKALELTIKRSFEEKWRNDVNLGTCSDTSS